MDLKVELGKRIQYLRNLKEISQEVFAEKIGINRNSLSKIETGKTYPKAETLEKIKEVLNIEFEDLYTFDYSEKLDLSKISEILNIENPNFNKRHLIMLKKLTLLNERDLSLLDTMLDTLVKNSV
ncbi:helix-turn-helix transcriptional regulator [bacterium]|nr:helix-turn-helix transcriptional regulator [bacterium]